MLPPRAFGFFSTSSFCGVFMGSFTKEEADAVPAMIMGIQEQGGDREEEKFTCVSSVSIASLITSATLLQRNNRDEHWMPVSCHSENWTPAGTTQKRFQPDPQNDGCPCLIVEAFNKDERAIGGIASRGIAVARGLAGF